MKNFAFLSKANNLSILGKGMSSSVLFLVPAVGLIAKLSVIDTQLKLMG